jgi:short-subunit dehydrogenase
MVSSLAGRNPIAGLSAYCASKAALDQLAACLMLEVRHQGVKVTTIAPGSVDTAFGGAPRPPDTSWMLTAEDVAQTVVDLLRMRVEMRPARPQKR